MILIDLNQILFAAVLMETPKESLNETLIRAKVYNVLRTYVRKHKSSFGEVVIACDSRSYWRKNVFPHYKAHRKVAREESDYEWDKIFPMLNKIKSDLQEHFPYKVIEIENAEADDVIATLAQRTVSYEDVLIISSDNDFVQLQKWNNKFKIKQLNTKTKTMIVSDNPEKDLKEKIIRGDSNDGIPNILSPGNSFVDKIRQKKITQGVLSTYLSLNPEKIDDETIKSNYFRNKMLIDLTETPTEIREQIINMYDEYEYKNNKQKLLTHFIENKMTNFIDCIGDF